MPRRRPTLPASISNRFLASLGPATTIAARHTVGLVDALTRAETAGRRIDDGLPESLEEAIATYRHRYFKLKVAGNIDADVERLIAHRRRARSHGPAVSSRRSTATSSMREIGAVIELWRRIGDEPRLARLKASLLLLEQPIAALACAGRAGACARRRNPDRGRRVRFRYRRLSARACARLSRHLVEIVQGLLSRADQLRPRGAMERRGRRRALFHVGRRPHHPGGRRGAAGPRARDA